MSRSRNLLHKNKLKLFSDWMVATHGWFKLGKRVHTEALRLARDDEELIVYHLGIKSEHVSTDSIATAWVRKWLSDKKRLKYAV